MPTTKNKINAMDMPTLLYVEEFKSSLSERVVLRKDIRIVLLRFNQNMVFDESYVKQTAHIPCFIFKKENGVKNEVKRFKNFCVKNNLKIDYFYNDSEYNQETIQEFAFLLKIRNSLNKSQALVVRDKAVMKDALQKIGYRTMAYEEISSNKDVVNFSKKCGGFPVIVKWRKGFSSKEVYKIKSIRDLQKFEFNFLTNKYIVEQYCPHKIWCIDSLVQNGRVVFTFYAWLPYTNLDFAENKNKFAQITAHKKPDFFKFDGGIITQNIISEIGLKNGYIHLEVFVDPFGQPIICEFAWRTPGENMLLNHSIAFNTDVYSKIIDIMIERPVSLKLKGVNSVGDMFLPIKTGTISYITPYKDLCCLDGVINGHINYKQGDIVESKRQYTSCSGWVQVVGSDQNDVLKKMINIYKKFKIKVR